MTNAPPQPVEQAPRYLSIPLARPLWTWVFLAVNVAVWLLVQLDANAVLGFGLKVNELIAQGEYWRLLTAMFHQAWHGPTCSRCIARPGRRSGVRPAPFLAVYLLSGLLGSAFSYVLSPNPSLGASGAIYGLLGALVLYFVQNRQGFGEYGRRRLSNLIGVIALNLFITITLPNIDLWAHAGGLLGGLALGYVLAPIYRVAPRDLWGEAHVVDASAPALRTIGPLAVTLACALLVALGTWRWTM
jgi:membrane associated rhomboid family serine protease